MPWQTGRHNKAVRIWKHWNPDRPKLKGPLGAFRLTAANLLLRLLLLALLFLLFGRIGLLLLAALILLSRLGLVALLLVIARGVLENGHCELRLVFKSQDRLLKINNARLQITLV